mmetsp:Transcript_125701/g.187652  ORF Transcript_125701/g.187652 Transcript_125701/m.187652 type:complete len:90 (+) Transcript_125701:368-637(+)
MVPTQQGQAELQGIWQRLLSKVSRPFENWPSMDPWRPDFSLLERGSEEKQNKHIVVFKEREFVELVGNEISIGGMNEKWFELLPHNDNK